MSTHRIGQWGGRGGHQNVYRYTAKDRNCMGHCDWLPEDGDLCIRTQDAGDHFHNYVAIRQREDGMWVKCGKFGAYEFGEAIFKLEERDFHLALAGEAICLPNNVAQVRKAPDAAGSPENRGKTK
jgi:hypothetical protein